MVRRGVKEKGSIKAVSTFDRIMKDPKRRAQFEKGYEKFLFSEFLIDVMEEKNLSVRKLADQSGISTTLIQNIRSGKSENVSINTLAPLLSVLGYHIQFVKNT